MSGVFFWAFFCWGGRCSPPCRDDGAEIIMSVVSGTDLCLGTMRIIFCDWGVFGVLEGMWLIHPLSGTCVIKFFVFVRVVRFIYPIWELDVGGLSGSCSGKFPWLWCRASCCTCGK